MGKLQRVKKVVHAAQLATMEAAAAAGPEAVGVLRRLANDPTIDPRAQYSAAAKLVDIVLPRAQGSLVTINMGATGEVKSHLNLPPGPTMPEIDVTAKVIGKSALEIVREEVAKRALITPEARQREAFMRQRFGVTETTTPPEPNVAEAPKQIPGQVVNLRTEVETIPRPGPYPEAT